jgi:hypothetical protein
VEDVSGDPESHLVTVAYREDAATPDGIREAIVARGFEAKPAA